MSALPCPGGFWEAAERSRGAFGEPRCTKCKVFAAEHPAPGEPNSTEFLKRLSVRRRLRDAAEVLLEAQVLLAAERRPRVKQWQVKSSLLLRLIQEALDA